MSTTPTPFKKDRYYNTFRKVNTFLHQYKKGTIILITNPVTIPTLGRIVIATAQYYDQKGKLIKIQRKQHPDEFEAIYDVCQKILDDVFRYFYYGRRLKLGIETIPALNTFCEENNLSHDITNAPKYDGHKTLISTLISVTVKGDSLPKSMVCQIEHLEPHMRTDNVTYDEALIYVCEQALVRSVFNPDTYGY